MKCGTFCVISFSVMTILNPFKIVPFAPELQNAWDDFVHASKNGTFLLHRDFMEYHQDRFVDASLLIYKNQELVALFPANRVDREVYSHQGLTYGGVVTNQEMKYSDFVSVFQSILTYWRSLEVTFIEIKKIPNFYSSVFNDEIDHLAFVLQANVRRVDTCSVVPLRSFTISKSKIRDAEKARKKGVKVQEVKEFSFFWEHILSYNLRNRYQTQPVHSYTEIVMLQQKFPSNIRFYEITLEQKVIGGTVLFIDKDVVHVQYISGLEAYKSTGALDFLFVTLLQKFSKTHHFFDFGTSNVNNGYQINKGLLQWKEAFGARTVIQPFYRFDTKKYSQLDLIFDL